MNFPLPLIVFYTARPHLLREEKWVLILRERDPDFCRPFSFYCSDTVMTPPAGMTGGKPQHDRYAISVYSERTRDNEAATNSYWPGRSYPVCLWSEPSGRGSPLHRWWCSQRRWPASPRPRSSPTRPSPRSCWWWRGAVTKRRHEAWDRFQAPVEHFRSELGWWHIVSNTLLVALFKSNVITSCQKWLCVGISLWDRVWKYKLMLVLIRKGSKLQITDSFSFPCCHKSMKVM